MSGFAGPPLNAVDAIAGLVFARGQAEHSAVLLGATERWRNERPHSLPPAFLAVRERLVKGVRRRLGDEAFAHLALVGSKLSTESVCEHALALLDESDKESSGAHSGVW
jgi:hypothetical protein